ncbi:MAG: hypothetical protein Q4P24_14975, partial [Rhodobacterales bacterium]|nr:hypothetical protein [Rhodobacterales bacterium]
AGGTRTTEGADDLPAPPPDGHLVESERPARSATRTGMIAEHVEDHPMKAGRRMDAGKGRAGR